MRADAGAPGLCSPRRPVVLGGVLPDEAPAPQALRAPPAPSGDSSSVVAEALGHAETPLPSPDLSSTFLILTALPQKPSCCPSPPPQATFTQFFRSSHCLNPPLVSCSKAPSFPALYPPVDSVLPRPKALSCKHCHCGPRDEEPALHAGVFERPSPPAELCSPFGSVGVLSCQPPLGTTSAHPHHWGPDSRLYLESLGLGPLGQPSCHALHGQHQEPTFHTQPDPLFLPAKMPGSQGSGVQYLQ